MIVLLYRLRSENYKEEGEPTQSSSVHCDGLCSGWNTCTVGVLGSEPRPGVRLGLRWGIGSGVGIKSGRDRVPVGTEFR